MKNAKAANHKLLIVDDDSPILFALKEYFSMDGYKVDCAEDLETAEKLLNKEIYSIVITDLRLNGLYGSEGLEIVKKAREISPETKIIMMTSYSSIDTEKEAFRLGAAVFLQKPVELSKLSEIASELLKVYA